VVHRVAGRAAYAEQLRLRPRQSPMQEMFWFPYRSIWAAPIITCRRPAATIVNTLA